MLTEFGLIIPQGIAHIAKRVPELIEDTINELPGSFRLPGIGPITSTALTATVGNARDFANGRQLAAWLGLVSRQSSSGGKSVLFGISKRGDTYLRMLLIHGARAVIRVAQRNKDRTDRWLEGLLDRRNANVAAVALANKNARTVWALLKYDREFQPDYAAAKASA